MGIGMCLDPIGRNLEQDFQMHAIAVQPVSGKVDYDVRDRILKVGEWLWFAFITNEFCRCMSECFHKFIDGPLLTPVETLRLPVFEFEVLDKLVAGGNNAVEHLRSNGVNLLGLTASAREVCKPLWHPPSKTDVACGNKMLVLESHLVVLAGEDIQQAPTCTESATATGHIIGDVPLPIPSSTVPFGGRPVCGTCWHMCARLWGPSQ